MKDQSRDRAIERLLREPPDRGASSVSGVCLDVDTLAAWIDDELIPEERAAAELHVADCHRCQALLAAMATTTPITLDVAPWWRRPAFAWAIPLTAVSAALVIWVAVPRVDDHPARVVSVADSQTAIPPSATASAPPSTPARGEVASRSARQGGQRRKEARIEKKEFREQDAASRVDKLDSQVRGRSTVDEGAAEQNRGVAAQSSPVAATRAPSAPAAPAPAAMAKATVVGAAPIVEIVSSNPGSRWRIVGGRTVQRSTDGGSTWQDQQTGVRGPLTAGSSPSPSVCWLVGPAGIVVVTTDGRSWRQVGVREAVDLIAIRAIDAQSATVTTADGRTFTTTDGGLTWAPG